MIKHILYFLAYMEVGFNVRNIKRFVEDNHFYHNVINPLNDGRGMFGITEIYTREFQRIVNKVIIEHEKQFASLVNECEEFSKITSVPLEDCIIVATVSMDYLGWPETQSLSLASLLKLYAQHNQGRGKIVDTLTGNVKKRVHEYYSKYDNWCSFLTKSNLTTV